MADSVRKTLTVPIQLNRKTSASWTAKNPVLMVGEPGFEIDTGKLKIGDGVKTWSQLDYIGSEEYTLSADGKSVVINSSVIALYGFSDAAIGTVPSKGSDGKLSWVAQPDISNKTDKQITGTNGTAYIFNETDGGGAKFEHTDGLESFVGVNDGGTDGLAAQIYADKYVDGKWYGAKLDVKNGGMYYTVGDKTLAERAVADNELAVKGDIVANPSATATESLSKITIKGSTYNITAEKNAYNYIKQIADYLFEVQYSTENVDYDYANQYFKNVTLADLDGAYGACTGVYKDSKILRHLDWKYDQNVEFVVRRPSDPENNILASIGLAAGIRGLTKSVVESGQYHEKYKIAPFLITDGINESGIYVQTNVVPRNGVTYNLNPTAATECCITMAARYILDHCSTFADVHNFFSTVHIYDSSAIEYGYHFMIAKGTAWEIIELTADGYQIVDSSSLTYPVITNFRLTGVTVEEGGLVDWTSVEDYGMGVERFEIGAEALYLGTNLENIVENLKYTNLYTQRNWRTELCGEADPTETSHKLTVMDAKNNPEKFDTLLLAEAAKYAARTREDGKGTWQTVHSAIYDLSAQTFIIKIQERFDYSYTFALASETPVGDYATKTWVESQGYLKEHQDISGKLNKLPNVDDPSDPGYGYPYHIPYDVGVSVGTDKIDLTLKTLTLDNNVTKMNFEKTLPAATTASAGLMTSTDKAALANKTDKQVAGTNGNAYMFNESDGGGAKFEHSDGTWSFAGVNDGGASGLAAQVYAVDSTNNYRGSKLDVQKSGIYYTSGDKSVLPYAERDVAENEIAVKGDIANKQDKLIAGDNISIAADGKTISATDTTYTAGDGIKINNSVISIDSDQAIAIYDNRTDDANKWLTNGYIKTSAEIPTANLPPVCTGNDRWGVLFYAAENNENHAGLQQYFPIDGTYKGRVFYRSVTGYSAGIDPDFGDWELVPWSSEKQDKLTAGNNITIDSNNVISAITSPVLEADLTAEYTVGGIKSGDFFAKGTSLETIFIRLLTNQIPETDTDIYYGSTTEIPTDLTGLKHVLKNVNSLINDGMVQTILTGDTSTVKSQYTVIACKNILDLTDWKNNPTKISYMTSVTKVVYGEYNIYYKIPKCYDADIGGEEMLFNFKEA